jgi:hypothetical protein
MKHADRFAEIVCASEEAKLAYPKPTKESRRKANIDTSDLAISKRHFDRDADYRAWIRTHPCALRWMRDCIGDVEAAHLDRGGRGIKGSDLSCLPLCGKRHHKLLDGNSLDWEVTAYLWRRAWELLAEWTRKAA